MCVCVSLCHHMYAEACRCQKTELNPLNWSYRWLELSDLGTGNQTAVLCESNVHSKLPNHSPLSKIPQKEQIH